MNRILTFVGLVALTAAPISFAQAVQPAVAPLPQSTAPAHTQMRAAPGTDLRVELAKTVDAKKAKPGDPVLAKTVDELVAGKQVVSPRGTKIFGHVVSATPRKGDTPSILEIAFDKIELSAESQVPMKAVIQALSKPVEAANPGGNESGEPAGGGSMGSSPMGSPSGGRLGGGSPPTASTPNNGGLGKENSNPGATSASASGRIPLNAQGVIGMSDVSLNSTPQGDTTITSQKHNVKLDSGTQMVLRVVQ